MKLKLAILDLYDSTENQGMRCIKEIIDRYKHILDWKVFDVRAKNEIPDTSFDIYISSGGPGSPLNSNSVWDNKYYQFLDQIWVWNQKEKRKKYLFLICHSFQMACDHFKLGSIVPRKSMSFGTFPIHKTHSSLNEPIFKGLNDPFYVADFRRWQFIEPNLERFEELGVSILGLEKIRPHVPLERAIMAVRFSKEIVGVQFHPEADADGMIEHFRKPELKKEIITKYGKEKYSSMMRDLHLPERIAYTNETVIPNFLNNAIAHFEPIATSEVALSKS